MITIDVIQKIYLAPPTVPDTQKFFFPFFFFVHYLQMETMEYRYLGNSGLKVSVLSLGSWITFGKPCFAVFLPFD